jgi:hypothetical protein
MKLDPIETVARALFAADNDPILWCDHTDETRNIYRDYARIAAKMIRAAALEEAAKAIDKDGWYTSEEIAAAIRALKERP